VTYTASVVVAVALAAALDLAILHTRLLTRRAFWTTYAVVLGFQLLVNGLLTGLRIVRYDPHRIVGWRIAYAPVEDVLFGFAMVLVTLSCWVYAGRRARRADRAPARPTPSRRLNRTVARRDNTS
jgi:lycopene cyclase domain-containing protein